jgi:hypothetical protein
MKNFFIFMLQLVTRTLDTGQLHIPTNFTTPLYDPKVTVWCAVWSGGVLEVEDGQSHRSVTHR